MPAAKVITPIPSFQELIDGPDFVCMESSLRNALWSDAVIRNSKFQTPAQNRVETWKRDLKLPMLVKLASWLPS